MSELENIALVESFFKAWEGGTYAELRGAYDDHLADDCLYENSGLPPCPGKAAALALIDGIQVVTDIQSITAEIRGLAAAGDLVFSERVDHHFNSQGVENLTPSICGVMEVRQGKIAAWRDYFDPAPLLAGMTAH
ncbi:MAG: limonene-1,2-epoxide hydrolase family protein [Acidimicrobiia bacterium]